MTRRSITDEEIALIKAMKQRGMKNKDIQFFFNRPARPVNSGRITNIAAGNYGPSAHISAASDDELRAFVASHRPAAIEAAISVPAAAASLSGPEPTAPEALRSLFLRSGGLWRLKAGESDEHECKLSFGFRYPGKWLRAIAALANNRGGYVLFGVHDKEQPANGIDLSYTVAGLATDDFFSTDTVKLTELLKATFDPTPRIQKAELRIAGRRVGILYVHAHPSRPVIATRQSDDIREGDIFYRYPAQSSRIKYSDLRAMLDARDAQARSQILPMVEKLLNIGPDKAWVADLDAGALDDGRHVIKLNPDLVERLKFIKEGEFDEKAGAPTLRLVGNVEIGAEESGIVRKGIAARTDLIRDFLRQETPYDPREYIRFLVEGGQIEWLPLHYYARKARLDQEGLVEFIRLTTAPAKRRNWFEQRASGRISAFERAAGAALGPLDQIKAGVVPSLDSVADARAVGNAVRGLSAPPQLAFEQLLGLLSKGFAVALDAPNSSSAMSSLRKAVCRLDELFFRS